MSHKINKIWNKISYETIIFRVIMIRFYPPVHWILTHGQLHGMQWIIPWETVQGF